MNALKSIFLIVTLLAATLLTGCMAAAIVPLAVAGATVVNVTASDIKPEDIKFTDPSYPDDLRLVLNGKRLVVMSAGGTELHVAEAMETAGYSVTQEQNVGNVSTLTTSGRTQALQDACRKNRADGAIAVRLLEIKSSNGLGMFVGKLNAHMDVAIDAMNCKSMRVSSQTGSQEIGMTYGQKLDEFKQAGIVGAARLLQLRRA